MIKKLNKFLLDTDVQMAMDWGKTRNIFDVLEPGETRHSKMLAWLFDPNEGHMQNDYFFKALLREAFKAADSSIESNSFLDTWMPSDLELHSFNGAILFTELPIGKASKRKVDIAIIDSVNKVAIFVENKTGSSEGNEQTGDYFQYLGGEYKDFDQLFIFMDMYGNEAKDQVHWVNLNYDWLETAIEALLDRNILTREIEVILRSYKEHITGDYIENSFFKQPRALLSKIANEHRVFLTELKNHCKKFTVKSLLDAEENKTLCVYKRHQVFFDHLFQISSFEYYVERAKEEMNEDLEVDLKKNKFYVHNNSWEKYYHKEYNGWGVYLFMNKLQDGNYNLEIKVFPESFDNEKLARSLAEPLQKSINRQGSTYLIIAYKLEIPEEIIVEEIKYGARKVESFISNYREKSR